MICSLCENEVDSSMVNFNHIGEFYKSNGERVCADYVCERCAIENRIIPIKSSTPIYGTGRTVGIEIECNPTMDAFKILPLKNCDIKYDRSLRGHSAEIVSPVLSESNYEEWIDDICSTLLGSFVYKRCGLHVWIGTKDLSWMDAQNLLQYSIKWQRYFERIVSPSRKLHSEKSPSGSPMLIPYIPRSQTKSGFLYALYGSFGKNLMSKRGVSMMKNSKRCNDSEVYYNGPITRYWWLNIHGHFHRKAVEFRLHQGTTNKTKITNWVKFCMQIVERASISQNINTEPLSLVSCDIASYYRQRSEKLHSWLV